MTARSHSTTPRRIVAAAMACSASLVAIPTLAGCGSGKPDEKSADATPSGTPSIDNGIQVFHLRGTTSDQFVPHTLIAHAGTVRIVFSVDSDSAPHSLMIQGVPAATISLVMPGKSASRTFAVTAGHTYSLACNIHPGMTGSLVVH
jgi:plastocyanin